MRFSDIKQNPWDYDRTTVLNALKRYFTIDMPTDSPFPITKDSYTIYLTNETTEPIPVTLNTRLETRNNFNSQLDYIHPKTLETIYDNHFEGKPSFTDDFIQKIVCQTANRDTFLATIKKAIAVNYLEKTARASSAVLETYFGPYFEDLLKESNLPFELHFKYVIRNIHLIDIYDDSRNIINQLIQHPETKQWSLDKPFSEENEINFKKDCHTIFFKLHEQPKTLTRTLKLQNPLSDILESQLAALKTLPTTLYATDNGLRWVYDNGEFDYDNDYNDYNDRNRYDIDVLVNIKLTSNKTLELVFPIKRGQSLIPAQQLIDSSNQYLSRLIKKQLKAALINNTLEQTIEPRKQTITNFLDQLPKHDTLEFKENGNIYKLIKWSTEDVSYSYNNSYLITFEKEDDNYHYEANLSLYDINETLLKDLIIDLISKFQKGKLMISYAKIKFLNRIAPSGHNLENLTPGKTYTIYADDDPSNWQFYLTPDSPSVIPLFTFIYQDTENFWETLYDHFYETLTYDEKCDYLIYQIAFTDPRLSIFESICTIIDDSSPDALENINKKANNLYSTLFDDFFEAIKPAVKEAQKIIPELDVEDSVEPEDIFISIDGGEATEEEIADWAKTLSDSERFNKLLLFEKAYNALFDAVEEAGSTIYKPYQKDIDAWEKEIENYYEAYYGQFKNA